MTSADTEAMTALQELLNERQRYEGWLRALEQREHETAPHVYSRVRADYTLRLDRVLQRLSEQAEQLRATVQALSSRLSILRSREADHIDVRQEAELRAAVGEYSDEEWTQLRDEADHEISVIAEERRGVEEELAELERIVELTTGPEEGGGAAVQPERAESAGAVATAAATAAPHSAAASATVAPATASLGVTGEPPSIQDFLAVQSSTATKYPGAAPRPTVSVPQGDGLLDAPEVDKAHRSVGTSSGTSSFGIPPVGQPSQLEPDAVGRREQEKTLRCPECGTMNYATEWYCERCGGELTTF